ncbi:hypothetical protein BGW38_004796, partial [Lunasporangiospora selenospora]
TVSKVATATSLGFDRQELVRMMLQSLQYLGYNKAAQVLECESGYELECVSAREFRQCVLQGRWDEVEQLARDMCSGLAVKVSAIEFLVREQKFLELLEDRQIKPALVVLRSELTPLNINSERVHMLTSYMMTSSAEDLRRRAKWDGVQGRSRHNLLASLQKYIPPATMVPEYRLETLLTQAVEQQRNKCVYHDKENTSVCLYSDHACSKAGIPSVTRQIFDGHKNEVWYISFSHNGKYLASTSLDNRVIIWDMETYKELHMLHGHSNKVSCCAWSPDDSQLLTAGYDKAVKLWDVQTGVNQTSYQRHSEVISCLCWLPDGIRFISGSEKNMLLMSTAGDQIHSWMFPAQDLAVTPDGKTVIAMRDRVIRIISLESMQEISKIEESESITAISLSRDGQHLLVNVSMKPVQQPLHRDIRLWNLAEKRVVCRYSGYKQGLLVVRACFGGLDEQFVVSGSEDSKIYIWNRENGRLIHTLEGHTQAVTCVAWHPTSPTVFASASDDHTIRIWDTRANFEAQQNRILQSPKWVNFG